MLCKLTGESLQDEIVNATRAFTVLFSFAPKFDKEIKLPLTLFNIFISRRLRLKHLLISDKEIFIFVNSLGRKKIFIILEFSEEPQEMAQVL